jgi:putative membrane protein
MYGYDHFGMGFGGLGWLGMILAWVVPLVLLYLLLRRYSGDKGSRREKTALEILQERYARGEINRDEYLKRRADLET